VLALVKNGFAYEAVIQMSLPELNTYLEIMAPSRPGQQRVVSRRSRKRGA
jgi:hypothetical protein